MPSSPPSIDTHKKFNKSRGDERKDKSQRYKKEESFVAPKFPKKDRLAATARIADAPKQVDPSVYLDPKVKRTTETLYVGNLDFSTSDEDLYLAPTHPGYEWRTLLSPEFMVDLNMDSSSSRGHDVFHWT